MGKTRFQEIMEQRRQDEGAVSAIQPFGLDMEMLEALESSEGVSPFDFQNSTVFGIPYTEYMLNIRKDTSAEQLNNLVELLFSLEGRLQIYIGDALNAIEAFGYGDISELAYRFNLEPETLYYYKSVMKSVTTFVRTKVYESTAGWEKPLTLSHYALVMSKPERDQITLLSEALKQKMTVASFRKFIKKPTLLVGNSRRTKLELTSDLIARVRVNIESIKTKRDKRILVSELRAVIQELETNL